MKKINILSIIIIINCISLNIYLGAIDELWVYANSFKLANGYQIYQDLNVIQTPLFFVLGCIVLNIFGNNFFVFKIYGILMYTTFIIVIYILLRFCNINKRNSILYLIIIYGMLNSIMINGASYNSLVFIFVLLGIILEIKYRLLKTNKWWIQTIVAFVTFFTKQNVGIYYFIGICILQFMNNKSIKKVLKQILVFTILLFVVLAMFWKVGILEGFISYTILGIKEFAQKNLGINWMTCINILIPIVTTIIYFYLKLKKRINDYNLDILYVIGMMMLLFAYPLFNTYHVLLSIVVILLFAIYVAEKIFFKGYLDDPKYNKIINSAICILVTIMIIYSILCIYSWFTHMEKDDWNNPYFGAIFKEETKNEIEVITNYIKEKEAQGSKVYVFSNKASLLNIPLGICNGAMDLPMTGNFGKDGEEGMIEQIKSLKEGEILIDKEYDSDYQKPLKVRAWIENNLEKKGEIESFIIYNLAN